MSRKTLPLLLAAIAALVAVALFVFGTGDRGRVEDTETPTAARDQARGEGPASLLAPGELEEPTTAAGTGDALATSESETVDAGRARIELPQGPTAVGRVALPAGTPADEMLYVLSLEEPVSPEELYSDSNAIAIGAWDPEEEREELLAAVEVAPDGTFELPVPEGAAALHLALAGRYVYSNATTTVSLPAPLDGISLTGELGAWITGTLLPPPDATPAERAFEGVELELGPDITGGFNAFEIGEIGYDLEDEADAAGAFEFRAVPCVLTHGVKVEHDALAALVHLGVETEPGQHLELPLQMVRGARLTGRVVDEAGVALAGVEVGAQRPGPMGRAFGAFREADTDDAGAFVLENVALGEIELRGGLDGYRNGRLRLDQPLTDGEERTGLELVLEVGGAITGRVLFANGDPAPAAAVRASIDITALGPTGFMGAGFDPTDGGRTTTDESGVFSLTGLGDGAFELRATAEVEEGIHTGDWRVKVGGVKAGDPPVELLLEELATIAGLVQDQDGEPIQSFTVHGLLSGSGGMMGLGAEREDRDFTDEEEGRFELDGLPGGNWELTVTAPEYATSEMVELTVPVEGGSEELLFVLRPAAVVAGTVFDSTGAPISGAKVTLQQDLAGRMNAMVSERPETRSGVEGKFRLDGLDPGPLSLVASHDGFAASEPLAVTSMEGAVVEGVELRLRTGGTLTGEVLDDEGEPAVGLMVIVQRMPSYDAQHMLTSDAEGEFRVEHLEPGSWQVVATANFLTGEADYSGEDEGMGDFLSGMKMGVAEMLDGETTHIILGQPPEDPVLVRGRIEHAGEPVAGAIVSFVPDGGGGLSDIKMSSAAADGTYEVQLEKPGPHLVTVQHTTKIGQQNSIEYVEDIPEGVEEHRLDLELPLGRISGRVRGPDGEYLEGCRVTLNVEGGMAFGSFMGGHYVETVTDENGRYTLDYLRPGTYAVAVGGAALGGLLGGASTGGRVVRSGLEVEEGRGLEEIDFWLQEPGDLTGVVTGLDGGPVPEATVFIRNEDGSLVESFSIVTTDGTGRYTYKGLAPGSYSVSAKRGPEVSVGSSLVRVAPGEPAEAHVTLDQGTIVKIAVVDNTDANLRARVSVRDENGHEVSGMLTMSEIMSAMGRGFASGEQHVGPLPPGTYEVRAVLDDGRTARKKVKLTGKPERSVKLRVR